MANVLAVGPMICRFNPGQGQRIFKAIKVPSMPSFGGEVKPSAPCHKILQYVKNPFKV
jgi:hypothetical protein